MANSSVELFVHSEANKPRVIEAVLDEPLQEVLVRVGIMRDDQGDLLVFVGESDEALVEALEVEGGEDRHSPVDIKLTIEVLEAHRRRHVHVHRCRHVAVDVNFTSKTKRRRFSPATTIAVVTKWAQNKLQLDQTAAGEYVLQRCGSTEQPRNDVHLGELVKAPACSICFDLVREVTPQG